MHEKEYREIEKKLRSVTFGSMYKHKHHVIKKDGNRLGKYKHSIYSDLYFRQLYLEFYIM